MTKIYLAFTFNTYYSAGGPEDLINDDGEEDAREALRLLAEDLKWDYDHKRVLEVDLETGKTRTL